MSNPVIYYVQKTDFVGEIVALAPVALRPDDRQPDWEEMRITEDEHAVLSRGSISVNWYVALDPITNLRRVVSRSQPVAQEFSNLNPLSEALVYLDDPELIIERSRTGWCTLSISSTLSERGRQTEAEFWLVPEQNFLDPLGYCRTRLNFKGKKKLFSDPGGRTSIYSRGRFQRIQDARR